MGQWALNYTAGWNDHQHAHCLPKYISLRFKKARLTNLHLPFDSVFTGVSEGDLGLVIVCHYLNEVPGYGGVLKL